MKKSFLLLGFLVLVMFSFSCKKNNRAVLVSDSTELIMTLKPIVGENTFTNELKLTDFSEVRRLKITPVKVGTKSTSSIKISGLKENISLSNFTLQIIDNKDLKRNFGTINVDQTFKSADDLAFLQRVSEELIKSKNVKLNAKFTSLEKLNSDVKVTIKIDADFLQ